MNENDMSLMYESVKIRKISLELTDAALAVYLVTKKNYVPLLLGNDEVVLIGKRYLRDVLQLEVMEYECRNSIPDETGVCVFCLTKEDYYRAGELETDLIVDLSQAFKETIKSDFYYYFFTKRDIFTKGINLYTDEVSQKTYLEYIKSFLSGDIYRGPLFEEQDKYFDVFEEFIGSRSESGAWINLGSCGGDTIVWSLLRNLNFSKIYGIEADEQKAKDLRKNILLTEAFGENDLCIINDKCGQDEGCLRLDAMRFDERIVLINMDVEGDEISILSSAVDLIRRDRPVLAVCAYHKPDDLLVIPEIVNKICDGYRFVLRKYLSSTGKHYNGVHRTNELVLYALPVFCREE